MPKKVVKKPVARGRRAAAAPVDAESKREAQRAQDADLQAQVDELYLQGDETAAAVAKRLNISPTKVVWLSWLQRIDDGEVPTIEGKTEAVLVANIAKARAKADDYSSWGWLAARSGKTETWIKTRLEETGDYTPRAENIASVRSEANGTKKQPAAKAAVARGTKPAAKRKVRGNA